MATLSTLARSNRLHHFIRHITNDSVQYYLMKAQEFKQNNRMWECESSLKKALSFEPENIQTQIALATFYAEQKKFASAYKIYQTIIVAQPNNVEILKSIVETAAILRKWTDLLSFAAKAEQQNVKIPKIHYLKAKAYYEEEEYNKTMLELEEQKKLTPFDKQTIYLLGKVYIDLNKYDEAIEEYINYLKHESSDHDIHFELGMLYSLQNQYSLAINYFETAAAKGHKQDIQFLENLGFNYLYTNIQKGIEILNKVMEKKPENGNCLSNIANAYYKQGDFNNAQIYFNRLYKAEPNNIEALYMMGVSLIRAGEKDKGMAICDKAIELKPELAKLRQSKSIL